MFLLLIINPQDTKLFILIDICIPLFIVALEVHYKEYRINQIINDRWADNEDVVYIYTAKYYEVIKNDQTIHFAALCIRQKYILFSEVSQKKDWYSMLSYICDIENNMTRTAKHKSW